MTGVGVGAVEVAAAGEELLAQLRERSSSPGLAVRSLVAGPHQRVVLLALRDGGELPEHDAPRAATLHVLQGRVRLVTVDGDGWEVAAGQLLNIPPARHHVLALTDSLALLTQTPHPPAPS